MWKKYKITASILLFLLALLVGGCWYGGCCLESSILSQLSDHVSKHSGGLYQLSVKSLKCSITRDRVLATGLHLTIKPSALDSLRNINEEPEFIVDVALANVELEGIKLGELLSKRSVCFSTLTISQPEVSIHRHTASSANFSIDKQLSAHAIAAPFSVESIMIQDGSLNYYLVDGSDTSSYHVNGIKFNLLGMHLGLNLEKYSGGGPLPFDNILLEASDIWHITRNKMYEWKIRRASFCSKDSVVCLEHLEMLPRYDKAIFTLLHPEHHERMELHVARMKVSGFDLAALHACTLHADSILLCDVKFEVFKDRNITASREFKPMFYTALQTAPIGIKIKNINLSNGTLVYEELPKAKKTVGHLSFNSISLVCSGLSNRPSNDEQFYTVDARMRLMNSGAMKLRFKLPIEASNDTFSVSGTLGSMPLNAFNKIVEPLFPVRIKTGVINEMQFTIAGTSQFTNTNMLLLYSNLKVTVLKESGERIKILGFASRMVNNLLLTANKPSETDSSWVNTSVHRNPQRSSFNFLWQSMFAGIKASIDITQEKEARMRHLQSKARDIKMLRKRQKADKALRNSEPLNH